MFESVSITLGNLLPSDVRRVIVNDSVTFALLPTPSTYFTGAK